MRPDEELKKTFKVFISDNNIINVVYTEAILNTEENIRHSELIKEKILNIFQNGDLDYYKFIIDNSLIENKGIAPIKSREVYLNLFSNKKVKAAAIVGGSTYLKIVANLLAGLIFGKKQIKWFSDKNKAMTWLKNI